MTPFAHLHVHSEYSLLDGAIRIDELLDFVKSQGHTACALTDHGTMFGAIEFYMEAKSRGIKPILGCEIFFEGVAQQVTPPKETGGPSDIHPETGFHLVLLAKSLTGYRNLIRLISTPYFDGVPSLPVIKRDALEKYSEGLIALSSCALGEFGALTAQLLDGKDPATLSQRLGSQNPILYDLEEHVEFMKRLFCENYYVELIDNQLPEQRALLPALASMAKHFELPLVASADAHFLKAEDTDSHAILLAIKHDLTLRELTKRRREARFHVLSNEEAAETFAPWPEALANTQKIADQCQIDFKFGQFFLPKYPVKDGETLEDALERLSRFGLQERLTRLKPLYGAKLTAELELEYDKRLDYELKVIKPMGFAGYFLIVQDFINWAKSQDIPVGPGRGSGVGSLVAYSLKITNLDPIEHGLVFERFLNPERISMPDFDVDFCQYRREEVIQYVIDKYGAENVAQITTFGKMLAKAAIRDVGRALELGYKRVDKIAKLVPNELGITLKQALEREPRLQEEAAADSLVAELLHYAEKLEGLTRHSSVHAAGLVISDGAMVNYVPVYKTEGTGLITQYEMSHIEKVGLVKFDFLGLKTLTVIHHTVKLIRAAKDPEFDIEVISLHDAKVYKEICTAHTTGIFQLESTGMMQLVAKLQPTKFSDLFALVALFRPGPLGSGMVDDYIERKHGRAEIRYPEPRLAEVLKETYGVVLYQEQVIQTAALLASYSLGEADLLRRAMGKKKPEEMAKQKSRFVEGCVRNAIASEKADEIFELLAKFADYGFNKSHSAAYGLVSYQTAFLRTHYPAEYMAAIMTCDADNTDKIVRYVEECRRLKLTVLPPCINASAHQFTVIDDHHVRFGLGAVKGVGGGSLTDLFAERQNNGAFTSLENLAERVDLRRVGKKTLELLTMAGGLDCFGLPRQTVFESLDNVVRQSESLRVSIGQKSLFGLTAPKRSEATLLPQDDLSKETPNSATKLSLKQILTMQQLLAERKVLGVFLTQHPLDLFPEDLKAFGRTRLRGLAACQGQGKIAIPVFFAGVEERISKKGHRLIYIRVEDQEISVEGLFSNRDFDPKMLPPANTPVIVVGQVDEGFEPGTHRFKIDRLLPFEAVRKERIRRLILEFSPATGNGQSSGVPNDLLSLKQVLLDHPGKTSLRFKIKDPEYHLSINADDYGVEMSDKFLGQIRSLPLSVTLTYVV